MSIFSKIFSRNNAEYYLALDIGTEVAKALVFQINVEEKIGLVVGVGKERQKKGKGRRKHFHEMHLEDVCLGAK